MTGSEVGAGDALAAAAGGFMVVQEAFSGPLELLLALAEDQQVDLAQVSLGALADEFVRAVAAMPDTEPSLLADFLTLCSQLLVLKARRLLPELADLLSPEEREDAEAMEAVLRAQLEEYRRFRQVAQSLAEMLAESPERAAFPLAPPAQLPEAPLRVDRRALAAAFEAIWRRLPPPPMRIPRVDWDINALMRRIRERLAGEGRLEGRSLLGALSDRSEAVVLFLALLELLRLGEIVVTQAEPFGELDIRRAAA